MNVEETINRKIAIAKERLAAVKALNGSGHTPVEYNIVVKPIDVEEQTEGGIIIPTEALETAELAQAEGILVERTDMSFSFGKKADDSIDYWASYIPKVGDTVKYAKYSGIMVQGDDGEQYRVMRDKDIIAVRSRG